jgi:twitching motility protein PilU
MNDHKASDLYLTVNHPPTLRTEKGFVTLEKKPLTHDDINNILNTVLTARQKRDYESQMELNTSLDMGRYGRFPSERAASAPVSRACHSPHHF